MFLEIFDSSCLLAPFLFPKLDLSLTTGVGVFLAKSLARSFFFMFSGLESEVKDWVSLKSSVSKHPPVTFSESPGRIISFGLIGSGILSCTAFFWNRGWSITSSIDGLLFWIFSQQPMNHIRKMPRKLLRYPFILAFYNFDHQLSLSLCIKRVFERSYLIENASKRPNISFVVVRFILSYFWW